MRQSSTSISTTTSKKRFGTNANKLAKPAAPPIPNDRSDRNAKNGLLLLSTKKSASSSLTSSGTASGTGGGLLSSKATIATSNSSNTQSALLSAVGGGDSQQSSSPDAWGTAASAEKQNTNQQHTTTAATAAAAATVSEKPETKGEPPVKADAPAEKGTGNVKSEGKQNPNRASQPAEASWDEYGGRGRDTQGSLVEANGSRNSSSGNNDATTDQVAYMSKLAKERAEKRRQEEQAREAEQREKAARRLRALEEKMANSSSSSSNNNSSNKNTAAPTIPTRTLWDPDKGTHAPAPVSVSRQENAVALKPPKESSTTSSTTTTTTGALPAQQKGSDDEPVIHLSSYDDRNRGEQNAGSSAAPRMLFDPKSGSMVAVKARGGGIDTNGRSRRASDDGPNGETAMMKARSRRQNRRLKQREKARATQHEDTEKNGRKKQERSKDSERPSLAVGKKDPAKKGGVNPDRTLPRTCGVLYERDTEGNIHCADGCDADLGYGSHSVPGGRERNPDAYAEFVEQHELLHGRSCPSSGAGDDYQHRQHYENNIESALQTGLVLEETPPLMEWVTADDKLELVTGVDDSPTLKPTARTWAPTQAALALAARQQQTIGSNDSSEGDNDREDDMGDEDSSEPNPTGGLGIDPTQNMDFMSSPDAAGIDGEDPVDALKSLGLGALTGLDAPMFSASSATDSTDSEKRRPRHIFAFGSSETWASSSASNKASSGGGGWGSLTGASRSTTNNNTDENEEHVGGLFSSDIFQSANETAGESAAAAGAGPFISLSSLPDASKSWGSGLAGLGSGCTNGEGRAGD